MQHMQYLLTMRYLSIRSRPQHGVESGLFNHSTTRSFFVVGAALGTVGYLAHACTHTHVCTQQAAWLCPVRTWDKGVFSWETWRIF